MSTTIHHGDAREYVASLPAQSVHAVVTDPPYGLDIGRQKSGQVWDRAETNPAFDPAFWVDVLRTLKPGGLLMAFGASRTVHRLACAIEDAGFVLEEQILVWCRADKKLVDTNIERELRKRGRDALADKYVDCHSMFKPAYEPIVLARRPFDEGMSRVENVIEHEVGFLNFQNAYTPTTENLSRIPGAPSKDGVMNYVRGGMERSVPHAQGRYPHNMVFVHAQGCTQEQCVEDCAHRAYEVEFPGKTRFFRSFFHSGRTPQSERVDVEGQAHLTVKPQSVMRWLVEMATLPGQVVLDPFAGSGSTLVAAKDLGRHAIGCELDEVHVEIVRRRTS